MPKVIIPPPYRGPTQGTTEVDVDGGSVIECLEAVDHKFPGFLPLVVDQDGAVQRFAKLFLNGDQLDSDAALRTPVSSKDEVEVLAAIAGG
ncbi:MAG: MoaD/ThiS family protein [Deltaproteobacteria bacterium]|nr:MoaD/ThiS family protein [Deltaproteobacteria bacterium]MBW2393257.1 MoaD/ThiS family protein [Deltaproteobacteria bacterium]